MDLLKLLQATGQQDKIIATLASQFGLDSTQTNSAVSAVMGALSGGVQREAKQGGLDSIMGLLKNPQLQNYVDQPETATTAQNDGNAILAQLFGSKEGSRAVAANVEQQSGVSAAIIRKMLPMVAAMAMGSLGKSAGATSSGGGNPLMGMASGLLDQDGDGSPLDDIMGMIGKFK